MKVRFFRLAFVAALVFFSFARAQAETLYNGALNTTPGDQGWTTVLLGASESVSGGATMFDSTLLGNAGRGGYSWENSALDSVAGYTLTFDLKVNAESHSRDNRSGVSLIALSANQQGVELALWESEIWAQTGPPNLFQHGEGVAFDTKSVSHSYFLRVSSSGYRLFADSGSSPILTGALKNYASLGAPYNIPNFLFLGDDTGSARGAFSLARVTLSAAPEPASLILCVLCLAAVFAGRAFR